MSSTSCKLGLGFCSNSGDFVKITCWRLWISKKNPGQVYEGSGLDDPPGIPSIWVRISGFFLFGKIASFPISLSLSLSACGGGALGGGGGWGGVLAREAVVAATCRA